MKERKGPAPSSGSPDRSGSAAATRGARSVRERVYERWQSLAPLAVIAAAPLLNTACDPAPEPDCTESRIWVGSIAASARWIDQNGSFRVELTISSDAPDISLASLEPSVDGGTVESTTFHAGTPAEYVLVITPGEAGSLRVTATAECRAGASDFRVTLGPLGLPADGIAIPTEVE
ncbi:MAG: hypothetical protein JW751_06455 [Polyangiaceae bacterium]|nr:hypothetical protein [Polyangiaceae bacterium]